MSAVTFRTLISLRHGNDTGGSDTSAVLSERGVKTVNQTTQNIQDWINGKTLVLSSPIIRAKQTADIIAQALSADLVVLDSLKHDRVSVGKFCKPEIMAEAAKNGGYENVIVVTHYQLVNGIILAFKVDLPQIDFNRSTEPPYGHGFIVDMETGNMDDI